MSNRVTALNILQEEEILISRIKSVARALFSTWKYVDIDVVVTGNPVVMTAYRACVIGYLPTEQMPNECEMLITSKYQESTTTALLYLLDRCQRSLDSKFRKDVAA